MTPWCDDLVCSWRRLLADRHSLPFPWTLSLHRRWCPSASHHPLTFLFLLALTFPLPSPFPSLGLSLCRPWCPSASPHSFPSLSLGRLCQRSPRTCPVSLLCVESTQRKANTFAVGQVRPSGHPKPVVRYLSPTAAGGPWDLLSGGGGGAYFRSLLFLRHAGPENSPLLAWSPFNWIPAAVYGARQFVTCEKTSAWRRFVLDVIAHVCRFAVPHPVSPTSRHSSGHWTYGLTVTRRILYWRHQP